MHFSNSLFSIPIQELKTEAEKYKAEAKKSSLKKFKTKRARAKAFVFLMKSTDIISPEAKTEMASKFF